MSATRFASFAGDSSVGDHETPVRHPKSPNGAERPARRTAGLDLVAKTRRRALVT